MQQGQPMIILGEDSRRTQGKDAQSMNISAGKAVAESVRTTLGPKGMDKMLVNSGGSVVVTNDGVTILSEMDIDHPAANLIIEVSEAQNKEVADGTTTAVVVAGELLDQAEELIDQDVHATTIAQGYHQAAEKARELLEENAIKISKEDTETLQKIAKTAMTGKGAESSKGLLAELVVDACLAVKDRNGIDIDNVSVEKVVGGSIDNSELVEGVIVDKERVHENMPFGVDDANVALFDGALEVRETEIDAEVNITDPDQLQQLLDQEEKQLKETVDQLVDIGTDVVFVGDGIDDMAQHYLAKEGILAVRRAKSSDLTSLARATGGNVVGSLDDIEADDLGFAGSVAQKDIGGDERIFVEDVEDAKSVTLILRGGTDHVVDELERAIDDSLGVVQTTLEDGRVLPGGGASATELSMQLGEFASSVGGREQLAIEAFTEALDVIPRTLAENAGLDPIKSLVNLRKEHADGDFAAGLDAYTGEIVNMEDDGVVEPLRVKTQAIESATEAAVMIFRIDDIIAASDLKGGGSNDASGTSRQNEGVSSRRNVLRQTIKEAKQTTTDPESITVNSPDRILPNQPFTVEIIPSDDFNTISVTLPKGIEFTTEIEGSGYKNDNKSKYIELNPEYSENMPQELELLYSQIPDKREQTVDIEIRGKRGKKEAAKKSVSLTIQRARLKTRVSEEVRWPENDVGEMDIELQNTGQIRLKAHISVRTDDWAVINDKQAVNDLIVGFLNIGLHQLNPEELDPGPFIGDDTKRYVLRNATKSALSSLGKDNVEPPQPYEAAVLQELNKSLRQMIETDNFTPLSEFYEDIVATVLQTEAQEFPADSIQLDPIVDGFRLPKDAAEFTVEISYSDSAGNRYDPIEHTVRTDIQPEQDEPIYIKPDIRGISMEG
jgi:thermosome